MATLAIKLPRQMVKMHATVKKLRQVINAETEFDFWVRRWNDRMISVGAVIGTENRMKHLVRVLNANGFKTECNGKRGTSGEFIVDVITE